MWRRSGRCLPDDLGVHYSILQGGYPKGGLTDTDRPDTNPSFEVYGILSGEDVGHSCPTCDISPTYVLCTRVHAAHGI